MQPGNYTGKIVGHGTDERNGLAFVWFYVKIGTEPDVTCRVYLEGRDEEKSSTALRMARQTLRICGFDPDLRPLGDLDEVPDLLAGNEVPVRVSEKENNGKFYTNYDIALPRGMAKSKDEAPVPASKPVDWTKNAPPSEAAKPKPAAAPKPGFGPGDFDDIPFAILIPLMLAVAGIA